MMVKIFTKHLFKSRATKLKSQFSMRTLGWFILFIYLFDFILLLILISAILGVKEPSGERSGMLQVSGCSAEALIAEIRRVTSRAWPFPEMFELANRLYCFQFLMLKPRYTTLVNGLHLYLFSHRHFNRNTFIRCLDWHKRQKLFRKSSHSK